MRAEGLTRDALLDGQVELIQPAAGQRAGSDAVLLAAAVAAEPGTRTLDVGCGTGAAMLCLARRVPGLEIAGLELQPQLAALALRNIAANNLSDRLRVLVGDVKSPPGELAAGGFDQVFSNPPYFAASQYDPSPDPSRAVSRGELAAGELGRWLDFMLGMLKPGGWLTIIQRAERLAELLARLDGPAGAIAIVPLWPGGAKPAKRIIIRARKGSNAPLVLLAGLVLHNADGGYSDAAQAILRRGEKLAW